MILDEIVADKREQLFRDKQKTDLTVMRTLAEEKLREEAAKKEKIRSFYQNLAKDGLSIIGEFKKASPSLGDIPQKMDLMERIKEYNASVDAISCLTEEDHFHGNVGYLKEIRWKSELPILRKDFMIDEYQFYEAKVIGANAILLITGILDDVQMKDFYQLTTELGLDALFEAHTEEQMDRALNCGAKIVGVNNRDLRDFTIKLDTTKRLSKMVPDDRILVAESGIVSDEDVKYLKECRVDAFLIGRAFMEAANPQELAKHWKAL